MQVDLPNDALNLAKIQAAAAGYSTVGEYLASIIRRRESAVADESREQAIQSIQDLRSHVSKLSKSEIIDTVADARSELP